MRSPYTIQIPRSAWPDLLTVLNADVEELQRIVDYVSHSEPLPDVEDLVEKCAEGAGVPEDVAEATLTIAINIHRLMRNTDFPVDKVLDEFAVTLSNSGFEQWEERYSHTWEERRKFWLGLIDLDGAVALMSKARELIFESQCVLQQSAIITDIRHIYNDEATEVKGALVLHTLSVSYAEGGDLKQIHVTLSPKDVEVLSHQLQRAKQKSEVSNRLLQKMEIPELTPKRNLEQ